MRAEDRVYVYIALGFFLYLLIAGSTQHVIKVYDCQGVPQDGRGQGPLVH